MELMSAVHVTFTGHLRYWQDDSLHKTFGGRSYLFVSFPLGFLWPDYLPTNQSIVRYSSTADCLDQMLALVFRIISLKTLKP